MNPAMTDRVMKGKRAKRVTADDLVTEAQIEETGSSFLALDGWHSLVTDPKQLRGMGVTEPGMADRQYRRPVMHEGPKHLGYAQLVWIEWKRVRKGKPTKTSPKQNTWHGKERARGFLTLVAGVDFPATIEGFQAWYRASGLMRRRLR